MDYSNSGTANHDTRRISQSNFFHLPDDDEYNCIMNIDHDPQQQDQVPIYLLIFLITSSAVYYPNRMNI